jgi:hypothetical protein
MTELLLNKVSVKVICRNNSQEREQMWVILEGKKMVPGGRFMEHQRI